MSVFHSSLHGNILTPHGWVAGSLQFGDAIGRIDGVATDPAANSQQYILPGFIDLHVHGAAGTDVMEAGTAAAQIAALHARHGTTSLLATTMTAPVADLEQSLHGVAQAMQLPGIARILGVHLEGPFINPEKLGAQPGFVHPASMSVVRSLHAIAPIRLVTLAPEIDGNLDMVQQLTRLGIKVQLGHTAGTYEDAVAALQQGASGFTHLFNAMSRLDHRAPGMVGAALAHAHYAEIIPDLLHVHPGAIRAALRAIPGLYCVTDSTAATGMPDGDYMLGRQKVFKCMGGVRTADGTLAGSTLTMDQALRNLVSIGLDLAEASQRVSTFAADFLGITERGRIESGAFADLVVLDRDLNVTEVYVEGVPVHSAASLRFAT